MDATGLYLKYKVDRPLSPTELDDHLPQNVQSSRMPWHGFGVIKMNSTFLELVDKFYPEKGYSLVALAMGLFVMLCGLLIKPDLFISVWSKMLLFENGMADVFMMLLMTLPFIIPPIWMLHREIRYTHYPIRFNRKTRKVYVFRHDGTVMAEDWDNLYFTLARHGETEMEVRGHRLSDERRLVETIGGRRVEDSPVVLETFGLPWSQTRRSPYLTMQWEFVRRYMECPEELDDLAKQVDVVMPVADRRESFTHGFMRHFAQGGGGLGSVILVPMFFVVDLGRWVVMHVARIPKWPKEVEDACQIEPDDPWQLDAPPIGTETEMPLNSKLLPWAVQLDALPCGEAPVWNYAIHGPHDGKRPDYVE